MLLLGVEQRRQGGVCTTVLCIQHHQPLVVFWMHRCGSNCHGITASSYSTGAPGLPHTCAQTATRGAPDNLAVLATTATAMGVQLGNWCSCSSGARDLLLLPITAAGCQQWRSAGCSEHHRTRRKLAAAAAATWLLLLLLLYSTQYSSNCTSTHGASHGRGRRKCRLVLLLQQLLLLGYLQARRWKWQFDAFTPFCPHHCWGCCPSLTVLPAAACRCIWLPATSQQAVS